MKAILTAIALTVGGAAWAAPAPVSVNVTNTPLPVSVTNGTTNQNVTVTNSATNPVKTADAFVRTPVRFRCGNGPGACYTVPDGFRLVVETASLSIQCPVGDTGATGGLRLNHMIAPGSFDIFSLDLALQAQGVGGNFSFFTASQSVRFALDPGDQVATNSFCTPDSNDMDVKALVLGYLVSVNSPSLAP